MKKNFTCECFIDNICTLLANIKFICTSYRNMKKSEPQGEHQYIQMYYISLQYTYIVFVLPCHICKDTVKLHTKRHKYWTFYWFFFWVSTGWSVFHQCLLCFALHKMVGTRTFYMSSRHIKQRFICRSYRQYMYWL